MAFLTLSSSFENKSSMTLFSHSLFTLAIAIFFAKIIAIALEIS